MNRRRLTLLFTAMGLVGLALGYVAITDAVYLALTPPLWGPMEPIKGVGGISAAQCEACHTAQAAEWRDSGHARATTDPLYVADLAAHGAPYFCDHCHAPLVEQREETTSGLWTVWPTLTPRSSPNPRHIEGLRHEGVTCVACHARDGAMVGPFATAIAPHPVIVDPEAGGAEMCRPCHVLDLRELGDLKRPIMDTFAEWEAYRAAGGDQTCVDCHMPALADRPAVRGGEPRPARSHALRGPFDLDFVREGVGIEDVAVETTPTGGLRAALTLVNRSGHRVPTAEPHRALMADLELLNDAQEVIARDRHLVQRHVDIHTLIEGEDTSLTPRERRPVALALEGPVAPEARSARLVVRFLLWDPEDPVAKAAGLSADALIHTLLERTIPLSQVEGG